MGSNCKHKCFQNLLLKNVGPLWSPAFLLPPMKVYTCIGFLISLGALSSTGKCQASHSITLAAPVNIRASSLSAAFSFNRVSYRPKPAIRASPWATRDFSSSSASRVRLASGCCSLFPLGWQLPLVSISWLASMIKVALHSSGCMVLFHIGANWCGPFDWLYTGQNPERRQHIEVVPRPTLLI